MVKRHCRARSRGACRAERWRSIGGVGYGVLHVQENDTGPDDCNHSRFGAAASATPAISAAGEEIVRARLSGLGYIS
jgi:hypothetical protein